MIRVRYIALLIICGLILCTMAQPLAIGKHGGHGSSDSTGDSEKKAKSDSRLADYLISLVTDHTSRDKGESNDEEKDGDNAEERDKPERPVTPTSIPATASTPAATPEPALATPAPKSVLTSTSASAPVPTPAPVSPGAFSSPPMSISYLELNPPLLTSENDQGSGNSSRNYSAVKADIMLPGATLLDAVNLPRWKANVSTLPPATRGLDLPAGAIIMLILACAALVGYMAYTMIWKG